MQLFVYSQSWFIYTLAPTLTGVQLSGITRSNTDSKQVTMGLFPNGELTSCRRLPIPGFAFVYWYTSTGETYYPVKSTDPSAPKDMFECYVSNMSDATNQAYDCTSALNWINIGGYNMHIFDPRRLPLEHSTFNDLQTTIWLRSWVKCW